MPTYEGIFSHAVAIVYRGTAGTPAKVTFTVKSLGLDHEYGYFMSEVFTGEKRGIVQLKDKITVRVNPSGKFIDYCSKLRVHKYFFRR